MNRTSTPKLDTKKFLLERRLIEIRQFIRESQKMLADFPDRDWNAELRIWIAEHRREEDHVEAELQAHLNDKT